MKLIRSVFGKASGQSLLIGGWRTQGANVLFNNGQFKAVPIYEVGVIHLTGYAMRKDLATALEIDGYVAIEFFSVAAQTFSMHIVNHLFEKLFVDYFVSDLLFHGVLLCGLIDTQISDYSMTSPNFCQEVILH